GAHRKARRHKAVSRRIRQRRPPKAPTPRSRRTCRIVRTRISTTPSDLKARRARKGSNLRALLRATPIVGSYEMIWAAWLVAIKTTGANTTAAANRAYSLVIVVSVLAFFRVG